MSQEKVEMRKSVGKHPSTMQQRTTVIQRRATGPGTVMASMPGGGNRSMSMRMSMGSTPSFAQGTMTNLSQKNVANVLDTRAKEKSEMNVLNERFASYIEKVRFLEAQNKALIAECERLKKMRNFDTSEIKELYEQEIADSRKIIDDLSEEKAKFDATLCSLQDQLEDARRDLNTAEKNYQDELNKTGRLNDQIANYEGELEGLRLRIESLEDERDRLKKDKKTLQDDMARIRGDLDEETCKRIQAEMKLQTLEEDTQFQINVYEAEIKELRSLLDRDRSIEMKDIWKGEMTKAIKELNDQYALECERMQNELQAKYEMQMNEMKAGVNRDNMEALTAREESKKVKSKLQDLQPQIRALQDENARLKAAYDVLKGQYDDECRDHEDDRTKLEAQLLKLNTEMEEVMHELQALQDAKLSLELEIACYRKLLEAEEKSMRSIVEESSGARSGGAQLLSDMISGKGGSSEQKSSMSTSSRKVSLIKNARGDMRFEGCQPDGGTVTIKNGGSKGEIKLNGWTLKKVINGVDKYTYTFNDVTCRKGQEITLVAKGCEDQAGINDIVCQNFTWGTMGTFYLYDDKNNEKCSLDIRISN